MHNCFYIDGSCSGFFSRSRLVETAEYRGHRDMCKPGLMRRTITGELEWQK